MERTGCQCSLSSDTLPALDEHQLSVLHRVGSEWGRVSGDPETWRQALPVNPDVGSYPPHTDIQPTRILRFVRISLQAGQPPEVEATSAADQPSSPIDRLGYVLKRLLLGPPLKSVALAEERMRKLVALPVLSGHLKKAIGHLSDLGQLWRE